MKDLIKIIFFSIFLLFSFSSCNSCKKSKNIASDISKINIKCPTVENQINLFYKTIKVLTDKYESDLSEFDYEPDDELKDMFRTIFLEDGIWQNIISNFHPKASQQPDRFLTTNNSIKIKDISIVSINDKECTCNVHVEAAHWFYADASIDFIKHMYFRYYDDICLTEDDLIKFKKKEEQKYQEVGEGKPSGSNIRTEENHIFHLIKKNEIYKIQDFTFNVTSFSDY